MKLRPISLALLALVAFASCKTTSTNPPAGDGEWHYISSGTNQTLVIGQFLNSTMGYAAGTTGVVSSTMDGGSTWTLRGTAPVFSGSVTGSIYGISFLNATTGFVAGDQRDIFKTNDGGLTWQAMDASYVPSSDLIRSIYFTNTNTGYVGTTDAYAAASGYICQSTDGGATWNEIFATQGGIYNINFAANKTTGIAVGRYGVAYWTNDGGTTWNAGSSDQPNGIIFRTTFTSATTAFASAQSLDDNTHGYILRTDDAGHSWKTVYSGAHAMGGIDNNGSGTITAVGYDGDVVESTDGGTTWTESFAGTNRWIDIRYASQTHAALFGANGEVAIRDK